jgi:pimeloyl-ACP methyl ester carboxylesterase
MQMNKKIAKNGVRFLGVIGLTFLLLHIGVYVFQSFILFQPKTLATDYTYQFDAPFQEYWITSPDGNEVNALFFEANGGSQGKVVLYLHGNSDNLQRWASNHPDFTERGFDFLAIDYRGYGKSRGVPTEEGLYKDAASAYHFLLESYEPEQIYIFGRSLGTGVAGHLAAHQEAAMLMLETPYYSIKDIFKRQAPFLYLPFDLQYELPLHRYLEKIDIPVYIFHGTADEVIPYSSAAAIKPNLPSDDHFLTIPGGRHKGLNAYEAYQKYLDQILLEENTSLESPMSSAIAPFVSN